MASAAALTLAALVSLSGCSGTQDDDVSAAAASFGRALSSGDAAAACDLLAPRSRAELEKSSGQSCEQALPEEVPAPEDRVESVSTFGTLAQVSLGGDTIFLARYGDGWHVLAAGCTPTPREVYDCKVANG